MKAATIARDLSTNAVTRSAGALMTSTLVTAVLGFGFWSVAAWSAPAVAVGRAGAATALMALLGSVATGGFDALLIGELSRRPADRRVLVVRALVTTAAMSAILATVVVAALRAWAPSALAIVDDGASAALVVGGTVTATMAQVVDAVSVGAHRASLQLRRAAVASSVKLAALGVISLTLDMTAVWIFGAWVFGTIVSGVVPLFAWPRQRALVRRHRRVLSGLWGLAIGHHAMNLSGQISMNVLPLIVAAVLGDEANAVFYLAIQVATFAWLAPVHLATALFAQSSTDVTRIEGERRLVLTISAVVGGVVAITSFTIGPSLLGVFGPEYRDAALPIGILASAALPLGQMGLFMTTCRVVGRLRLGALVLLVESLSQLIVGAVLCRAGVVWLAVGVAVPTWLVAAYTVRRLEPTVRARLPVAAT
ncbi:MAG: lipopolysaccharide biosynthesis protein [Desertimonas sp.]